MKTTTFALALGIFLCTPLAAFAGEPPDQKPESEAPAQPLQAESQADAAAQVSAPAIVFVPPVVDAPKTRLRPASSRGAGEPWPAVTTLSPEAAGWTARAQPSLFWYLDTAAPAGHPLVFTLIREDRDEPVVERELPAPEGAGIQRIRLESMDVQLEPGVAYQWSVALVLDPQRRSRDLLARSGIERVATPEKLASGDGPRACAQAGLWYDAFALLEDGLERSPGDPTLAGMRASLLRQVGLDDVAESL